MKKTLKGLPLNLQMFAESAEPENDEVLGDKTIENNDEQTEDDESEEKPDAEKIVEKLKGRLASKTKEEKEVKDQLQQALERIAELEQGTKKTMKEKSDEEKEAEAQKVKDDEIAQLKQQIRISEITQQADEVLKESGLTLGKDMLSILVSDDEQRTYDNVKSLIGFLDKQQEEWETKRNTGVTPKKVENTPPDPFAEAIKKFK